MHRRQYPWIVLFLIALTVASAPLVAGVWGAPDQVPAATLVVPMWEVGIDQATHPQSTNFTVYAARGPVTLHYELYSIDGVATISMYGNVELSAGETWSSTLSTILAGGFSSDRALLTDGDFYRGFMTIDVVTEDTALNPFNVDYPFGSTNAILGNIYYLRLSEGSANGLPMIGLEYTSETADPVLEGFYGSGDGREEIDDNARECSATLTQGNAGPCGDSDHLISAIRARVFHSTPLNGSTRVVVFTWTTNDNDGGGPSALCDGMSCDQAYSYTQKREDGSNADSGLLVLPHVVNIIETTGPNPGELLIFGIPDPNVSMQTYAFSINSANPVGNPDINWDAIFEASIQPAPTSF